MNRFNSQILVRVFTVGVCLNQSNQGKYDLMLMLIQEQLVFGMRMLPSCDHLGELHVGIL